MSVPVRVVDTGLMSARRNVAITAALHELHRVGQISDTLRFSSYSAAVLVGRQQRPADVVRLKTCRRQRVEIARRITKGDAFYAGAGILTWDLVADRHGFAGLSGDVTDTIRSGLSAGLARFGLPVRCRPRGNVELAGRTIAELSGTIEGPTMVFQGTVLVDVDVAEMERVFRQPRDRKSDESGARLGERITSLSEWLGRIPSMHEARGLLLAGLSHAWRREFRADRLSPTEQRLADLLLARGVGTEPFGDVPSAAATAGTHA